MMLLKTTGYVVVLHVCNSEMSLCVIQYVFRPSEVYLGHHSLDLVVDWKVILNARMDRAGIYDRREEV